MNSCGCGPVVEECRRYKGTKHWDLGACGKCGNVWLSGTIDPMDFIDTFAQPAGPVTKFKLEWCRFCAQTSSELDDYPVIPYRKTFSRECACGSGFDVVECAYRRGLLDDDGHEPPSQDADPNVSLEVDDDD